MLNVRDIELGKGSSKIIVPVMGAATEDVISAASEAVAADADMVEWRADYFQNLTEEALLATVSSLRSILGNVPLLFTIRSASQGGEAELSDKAIACLIKSALTTGEIDIVDVELDQPQIQELIALAHEAGIHTLVSWHHFRKTPTYDQIYDLFQREVDAGADIAKVAVMACEEGDELRLMAACRQCAEDNPQAAFIGVSMGELGLITRIAGQSFGSVATFCSVGRSSSSSAPGQLDIATTRAAIAQLYQEGYNSSSTE